jgi:hypothetical protein
MSNNILKFRTSDQWVPGKEHFQAICNVPFVHDEDTSVDYFLLANEDTLFCVFQGSSQKKDWKDDFTFFPQKFDIYPGSKIMAHMGIARQYLAMRKQFLDLAYCDNIKNILIAGFSLGGGLSQLACEDAAWHFSARDRVIKSISYEGPRVVDRNNGVRDLLDGKQLLVKTFWDPVVHLPFRIMGLYDYGKKNWIGKWNRILPLQHLPEQVEKNLYEKYSR